MSKTTHVPMSMSELRKLSSNKVRDCGPIVVTRYRKPTMVLLSYKEYENILRRLEHAETKVCDLKMDRLVADMRDTPQLVDGKLSWKK